MAEVELPLVLDSPCLSPVIILLKVGLMGTMTGRRLLGASYSGRTRFQRVMLYNRNPIIIARQLQLKRAPKP